MFLQKSSSVVQKADQEGKGSIYTLMRSYVEHECKQSRTYIKRQALEKEIQDRLAKIFS